MLLQLRTLMLPLAMLAGYLLSGFFAGLGPMTPFLIFGMLFISFCRISPRELRFKRMYLWLLAVQLCVSVVIFLLLRPLHETGAQAMMVCILAPTATSAIVIAGMLGADMATMAGFTLLSNSACAIAAPLIFSFVGTYSDIPFLDSFLLILGKVVPVLILPFATAITLHFLWPRATKAVSKMSMASFYMWALSLIIVTGQTVEFIKAEPSENYGMEFLMALGALGICVMQFAVGRAFGRRYGERIAGGQSLGQKNTVLAIWMTQTYLDPVSSIGPASYVLWQNVVNSWQLWSEQRRAARARQGAHRPE